MTIRTGCKWHSAAFVALAFASSPAISSQDGHEFTNLLGFELNAVALDDIQRKLGGARLVEQGDAAEYEASICYVARAGVVRFLSGELGGEVHELLGFEVSEKTADTARACAELPPASVQIAGLHLGMTRREFATAVGENVRWEGDIARRFFAAPQRKSQPHFDASVSIVATFAGERLIDFKIWKLRTD